ncbi:MAG: hypothetical protein ACLT98_07985 [Eggerthellaceae bacterium]
MVTIARPRARSHPVEGPRWPSCSGIVSPLVGREATSWDAPAQRRLMREKEQHLHGIEELEDKSGVEVAGRGLLHLSVLPDDAPQKDSSSGRSPARAHQGRVRHKLEPIEEATVDVPSEYAGKAIEVRQRRRRDVDMYQRGDQTHLVFRFRRAARWDCASAERHAWRSHDVPSFLEYGPIAAR